MKLFFHPSQKKIVTGSTLLSPLRLRVVPLRVSARGPEFKTSRRAAETQSFLMTAVGTYGLLRLDSALWQARAGRVRCGA
jgi:hypothetical protein